MQSFRAEKPNTALAEKGISLLLQRVWAPAAKLPEAIATAIYANLIISCLLKYNKKNQRLRSTKKKNSEKK